MEEAKVAYEASASLPMSQLGLGRLMLAAGDSASALPFVEKALAVDPGDPVALKLPPGSIASSIALAKGSRALERAAGGPARCFNAVPAL
jgi:hypothetical protein